MDNDLEKLKKYILNLPKNQYIYFFTDEKNKKTISSMTLIIEPKIIHNYGFVCVVEDVIVDSSYRGQHIGR